MLNYYTKHKVVEEAKACTLLQKGYGLHMHIHTYIYIANIKNMSLWINMAWTI